MDPSDEVLAKLYRWTLHTRWGVEGAPGGSGIGAQEDFTCMCDGCRKSRRAAWFVRGANAPYS